jgi:hypothetical protein
VIVVRHSRKGGGEVGEAGRGSSAFAGAMDLLVSLQRRRGNHPKTQRIITTLGRFDEPPDDLVIDLTEEGYVSLGAEEDAGREEIRAALFGLLRDGAELSEKEVLSALEGELGEGHVPRSSFQRVKNDELEKGTIVRTGTGKSNDAYRYALSEFVSAQPSLLGGQKGKEAA